MDEEKPPPPDESSAFKDLLEKLLKVPKREMDKKEEQYRKQRETLRKRAQ